MKTTIMILATLLTLTSNILVAGNDLYNTSPVTKNVATIISLVPAIPSEATFEDADYLYTINNLMPAPPSEAGFEDATAINDPSALAPAVPAVADFEDAVSTDIDVTGLAPVLPAEADFE